jgi:fused signal recognition particle receptor
MFGFLRRKKPPEAPTAPPDAAPAPVMHDPGAAGVAASMPAQGPDAGRVDALPGTARVDERPDTNQPAAALAAADPMAATAAAAVVPSAPPATPASTAARSSWMTRLRSGLSRTRTGLTGLFRGVKVDEALFEDLEGALLMADTGVDATQRLLAQLRARVKERRLDQGEQVRAALRELLAEQLASLERPMDIDVATPLVMMIAGVNGAGKTTSIGKLAHHLQHEGKSILLAAGDTFRAAAREQLATWGARNDVQVIAQQGGDPAAVAFDAVSAGLARRTGVVMIDTAGRLPTQAHLMEELKKIRRVIGKAMPDAPHEVLLILDGNTGQNMLGQVKAFDEAVGLTGLIVTKLDGTAKGGALVGLAYQRRERPIPVYFIGVGEGIEDLQAFSAAEFAEALLGAG